MRPLVGKSILTQYGRNLAPVANPVKEDVRCDPVLARRDRPGGESLKRNYAGELGFFTVRQKSDYLSTRTVSNLEHIVHGCLSEFLPVSDWHVEKPFRVSLLDGEDVQHDRAHCSHSSAAERDIPRFGVLDEPFAPAVLLGRCELEQQPVAERAAILSPHTLR